MLSSSPLPCKGRNRRYSVNTDLTYLLCPLNISFHSQKGFSSNTFTVLMRLEQTSCVNRYSLWSQWFPTVSMMYVRYEAIFMYVKQAVILPILFHLTLGNALYFLLSGCPERLWSLTPWRESHLDTGLGKQLGSGFFQTQPFCNSAICPSWASTSCTQSAHNAYLYHSFRETQHLWFCSNTNQQHFNPGPRGLNSDT